MVEPSLVGGQSILQKLFRAFSTFSLASSRILIGANKFLTLQSSSELAQVLLAQNKLYGNKILSLIEQINQISKQNDLLSY